MACVVLMAGTWLSANRYTGNRKKEKWNRSSCVVDGASIKKSPDCCRDPLKIEYFE